MPGIDCNLSPPKSVSALLPFLSSRDRAELERAHLAAVRVTLGELERRVAVCRPTVNGQQIHAPGELGIAVFTDHTSRPTIEVAAEPGRPPDPQLRSHAFVFNLAFCQGRWLAVDSRPIYQFATTADAIFAQAPFRPPAHMFRWLTVVAGSTCTKAIEQRRDVFGRDGPFTDRSPRRGWLGRAP